MDAQNMDTVQIGKSNKLKMAVVFAVMFGLIGLAVVAKSFAAETTKSILFVTSSNTGTSHDMVFENRWTDAGFTVTVADDNSLPTATEAEEFDIVWISSSVNPQLIGDAYRDIAVPVGLHEPLLYDDMSMASGKGQKSNQNAIKLEDGSLDVVLDARKALSWGTPSESAVVTASLKSTDSKAVIFTYDKDSELVGGTPAPQCRAGFFAGADSPSVMNDAGFAYFDAITAFLSNCAVPNTPPQIGVVSDQAHTEGDVVALSLSASDAEDSEFIFSAAGLPSGLSIDSETGAISGTIDYRGADNAPYTTQITLTDTGGLTDGTSFTWTVQDDPALDPEPTTEKNVIVVMTDDQTVEQMRWLPSIKAYMQVGTEYENSLANYPLCGPSRATFLTGQQASNHGLECNSGLDGKLKKRSEDTLAPWLQTAGVHTIHVGKYLNGYGGKPSNRYVPDGWDDWRALAGAAAYNYTKFDMFTNGEYIQYGRNGDNAYSTDILSDELDEALRAAPMDKPFFSVFTPLAPHYKGGKAYAVPAERHKDTITDVLRAPNYDGCISRGVSTCAVNGSSLRGGRLTAAEKSTIDNGYQTSSETLIAVDEAFQRITATLAELGRLDNTVIMFTSDNGFMYGEHGIERGKIHPTREALFVPLYISGPGFNNAAVESAPVSNIDLAPTILDIFDAQATSVVDGQSLLDPINPERAVHIEASKGNGNGYKGVYSGGWLFYDWNSISRNELYAPDDTYQFTTLDKDNQWNAVEAELGALTDQLSTCSGVIECNLTWTPPQ